MYARPNMASYPCAALNPFPEIFLKRQRLFQLIPYPLLVNEAPRARSSFNLT